MIVNFLFFAVLLAISYGIMFIDSAVGIFPAIKLDYSTHTAVAFSLVYALCLLLANQWKIIISSILGYTGLLYRRYHTIADVVVTAAVISVFALGFFLVI